MAGRVGMVVGAAYPLVEAEPGEMDPGRATGGDGSEAGMRVRDVPSGGGRDLRLVVTLDRTILGPVEACPHLPPRGR
jgi:hypothetical protein